MPVDLIDNFDNDYTFIDNDGPVFYFRTDWKAPNRRIIAIDTRKPGRENWKEIVPEAKQTIESAGLVGNQLVVRYLKDAHTQVKLFAPDGAFIKELELPGIGSANGFGGRRIDTETFYLFSSYATPPSIYRYDFITGKSNLLRAAKVQFDAKNYEVKQVFYKSKDGTKVPMFITYRKGIKLDGQNPTLALRLRRIQYPAGAELFDQHFRVARDGGRLCRRQSSRRRRIRKGVARWRPTREQAERLRRLHRRRRVSDSREIHIDPEAGDQGRIEWRPIDRSSDDAAARPVRRVPAARGRHGYAAFPQIHRRAILGRRLRLAG